MDELNNLIILNKILEGLPLILKCRRTLIDELFGSLSRA
jgi:hypothetical protein